MFCLQPIRSRLDKGIRSPCEEIQRIREAEIGLRLSSVTGTLMRRTIGAFPIPTRTSFLPTNPLFSLFSSSVSLPPSQLFLTLSSLSFLLSPPSLSQSLPTDSPLPFPSYHSFLFSFSYYPFILLFPSSLPSFSPRSFSPVSFYPYRLSSPPSPPRYCFSSPSKECMNVCFYGEVTSRCYVCVH